MTSWDECLKYVKGVKGAKYKSFEDIKDAEQYLKDSSKLLKKGQDKYPLDCLHIYVDGSYNSSTQRYSYGVVAVRNNVVEHIESNSSKDNSQSNIRQIAGELQASIKALEYALIKGDKKVVIFHDYEGVAHHATGFWERKEQSSVEYYNKMNELINKGIEVIFVKVDSHQGDLFNELVDEKCKEKLSIQSDKTVEKWLSSNIINVCSEDVKQEILKIAPNGKNNIIVLDHNEVNKNIKDENNEFKFREIINKYLSDQSEVSSIINNLSVKEKTDFIMYLLQRQK